MVIEPPRCVAGGQGCPPEDCGGVHGYQTFLAAIADPRHEEYDSPLTWVGGSYGPDAFDPAQVIFDDPRERWKKASDKYISGTPQPNDHRISM